jgi:hypothetical protein
MGEAQRRRKQSEADRWRCLDCRTDTRTEYFMIHDELWIQTGIGHHGGKLCIACLEERIGRRLTSDDFLDVPINWIHYDPFDSERSARLTSRLQGLKPYSAYGEMICRFIANGFLEDSP